MMYAVYLNNQLFKTFPTYDQARHAATGITRKAKGSGTVRVEEVPNTPIGE